MCEQQQSILIVEDNEDDILLIRRALKKGGVTVRLQIARDGEEAIDYLAGSGCFQDPAVHPLPTLVLLDLKLPKKTGLEVLEWIRSHATLSSLPVVVFTTSVEPHDLNKAYALGVNSYLKKPISMEDTTALLKTLASCWTEHHTPPPNIKRK